MTGEDAGGASTVSCRRFLDKNVDPEVITRRLFVFPLGDTGKRLFYCRYIRRSDMSFDYFYGPDDAEQYLFYRIPKYDIPEI